MPAPTDEKTKARIVSFFALVFIVFTCSFPYLGFLNNPNENVRTYMAMAAVEQHTFRIDSIIQRQGWVNDMAKVPEKGTGQFHYYSVKGPAVGYMAIPFYWAFTKVAPHFGHPIPSPQSTVPERLWWMRASTLVLRFFVVQVPCLLFLVWFERWLRNVTPDVVLRLIAVAAAALGTNYLAYSLAFVSHSLFAVTAFMAFGIITTERLRWDRDGLAPRVREAAVAGFFASGVTALEYHGFAVSFGLALFGASVFRRELKTALAFVGAASINILAVMYYQWRCFDNPFTPGHKLVDNPQFAAQHHQGLFGIGLPSPHVLHEISLNDTFGFFTTSPFMVLGLLSIPFALFAGYGDVSERRERRIATATWLAMMAALWASTSGFANWHGGWSIGPRYLGAAPPFFAFGAVVALEWISRRGPAYRAAARGLAGGLMLAGVAIMGLLGLLVNTIPETVPRPLTELVIPLIRAGFVPYHAFELAGFGSATGWYVVAFALLGAAMVAALWPSHEGWARYALRSVFVLLALGLGLRQAVTAPPPAEAGDLGAGVVSWFAKDWEPHGRDRITKLRADAEAPDANPCDWYKVADIERLVKWNAEADRDERRARTPRAECP